MTKSSTKQACRRLHLGLDTSGNAGRDATIGLLLQGTLPPTRYGVSAHPQNPSPRDKWAMPLLVASGPEDCLGALRDRMLPYFPWDQQLHRRLDLPSAQRHGPCDFTKPPSQSLHKHKPMSPAINNTNSKIMIYHLLGRYDKPLPKKSHSLCDRSSRTILTLFDKTVLDSRK